MCEDEIVLGFDRGCWERMGGKRCAGSPRDYSWGGLSKCNWVQTNSSAGWRHTEEGQHADGRTKERNRLRARARAPDACRSEEAGWPLQRRERFGSVEG